MRHGKDSEKILIIFTVHTNKRPSLRLAGWLTLLPIPSRQLSRAPVVSVLRFSLSGTNRTQSEIRKYRDVYRLYEFPRRPPSSPQINGSMTPRRKKVGATVAVDSKAAMGWAKHVSRGTVTTPQESR